MKKIVLTLVATLSACAAFAQGTVTWGNSSSTALRFADGPNAGSKVFAGSAYVVGLYLGAQGGAEGALSLVATRTLSTAATAATSSLAGVFLNQTYTSPSLASGANISYMIKCWSAGYDSYEAALQNPTLTTYAGKSGIGGGALGGGSNPALSASLSTTGIAPGQSGVGAVAPFTIALVPEPASAAILGLGMASLLIFRRRK